MLYERLKDLIEFCDTMDSAKLVEIVNNAGFLVAPNSMRFIEVASIKTHAKTDGATVYVLYIDKDRMSDCFNQEMQIHFDWTGGVVSNLDFVQIYD